MLVSNSSDKTSNFTFVGPCIVIYFYSKTNQMNNICMYSLIDSWWWTKRPSETCRVLFQNKINWRYYASGWVYYRNNLKVSAIIPIILTVSRHYIIYNVLFWFLPTPNLSSLAPIYHFNPLETKRRLFYLKTQSVPRCKHFSSRL